MKGFVKTYAGKCITFAVCILSLILLLGSVFGIFVMVECDFYTKDKQSIENSLVSGEIKNDLYPTIYEASRDPSLTHVSSEDYGNLMYKILNDEGTVMMSSKSADSVYQFSYDLLYIALYDKEGNLTDVYYSELPEEYQGSDNTRVFRLLASVKQNAVVNDIYSFEQRYFPIVYSMRFRIFFFAFLFLALAITSFIILMNVAGRRKDQEGLYPGPLHKVPFDLLAFVYIASFVFWIYILDSGFTNDIYVLIDVAILLVLYLIMGLGLCMSFAVRIKDKSLIKGSLIYKCVILFCRFSKYLFRLLGKAASFLLEILKAIPMIWKMLALFVVTFFIELFLLSDQNYLLWFIEKLCLFVGFAYFCLCMYKLMKASHALASGDLSYQVDTSKMIWDLKKHGEDLNSIGKGMAIAVEDRLKSERMKTELITNVSHDIKTPLTSIINYADLIHKEKTNNKKIGEYAEVLLRQSVRLKRLLEDLVEASKASSGNLDVAFSPCDASIFLEQAQGEYEEKLKEAKLELITSKPDHEVMIMADPRRMWRIFDNLMNNICKYALSGTRVYLSLEEDKEKAIITFKNTSRDALNIPAEELMERFKRGDESRNSEGNGLGLSIAQSLAQLQNGDLSLSIDGDLFKAILSFDKI